MRRPFRGLLVSLAAGALVCAVPAATGLRAANHLGGQSSPYLLQHAKNPVDWYPWGDEALRRAAREDKPIFLSIGYSACHWCHVMEREAFSDVGIARYLEERFVSIKVDREERPDLDALYMNAVLAMTGRGGWPMTVFLTPDLKPFYGGTYFPTPAFDKLIRSIAMGWKDRRGEILKTADTIASVLADLGVPPVGAATDTSTGFPSGLLDRTAAALKPTFDRRNGGFGTAPKFPPHGALLVLLESWRERGDREALEMVTLTLEAMARGGIHDQLGGGFHRYATDERWLAPHFEKMLYDNALLVPVYLEAWKASGRVEFRRVAERTLAFVTRELGDPKGGFYATLDADSEGEEGKYYLWNRAEIEGTLGPKDGPLVADFYGVTGAGSVREAGRRVLSVASPPVEFAVRRGLEPEGVERTIESARPRLLAARARRPAPRRDDKILAGWNGLMISACARAYALTGDAVWRRAGERAARFVLDNLLRDGTLHVSWRRGRLGPPGFLDDHAFLARGLLDLGDATGNSAWRERAARLVRAAERFADADGGGYFLAAAGQKDLIVRSKILMDDALPSGNAVMAECLLRLGRVQSDPAMRAQAARIFALAAPGLAKSPLSSPYMVLAAGLTRDGQRVTGEEEDTTRPVAAREPPRIASGALAATRDDDAPAAPPAAAAKDRIVPGTIVGRAGPQRVVTTGLTVPDRPVRPGQAVALSIRLDIQTGWHVNSNTPNLEYLIPTKVVFPDADGVRVDQIVYPQAHLVTLKFADTKLSVYEGSNTIRAIVRPPRDASAPGEIRMRARLTYQSCSDTTCLAPETVEFTAPLRIEGEPVGAAESGAPAAGYAAQSEAPSASPGGDRMTGGASSGDQVAAVLKERGLLALIGLVFLGGLALNLTPCIYPMIPVTIGFFASQARSGWLHRIGLPVLYVLGMAVTYSILGVVAGLSGGLVGSTLQNRWIVGALVILFVVMGIGMFGLFDLRLPGSITRLSGGRRGPVGALVMGLTMGLVAAPCIGPFVVGLLAFVGATASPVLGFWLFFVMAIGMGLPNLVLGVFSGSLSNLPRSGQWLLFAKKVMGVGMFAVALYFLQPFLGDRLLGILVVAFALVAGVYLAFFESTRLASRFFPALKAIIGVALVAGGVWFATPLLGSRAEPAWEPYSPEALARASAAGRPVLIDFTADWCLACKELERYTFTDPGVLEEAERFVLLRADLTQFESEEVRSIRDRFDVVGLPTLVFLDGRGNERRDLSVFGFEDAKTFLTRMRQVR